LTDKIGIEISKSIIHLKYFILLIEIEKNLMFVKKEMNLYIRCDEEITN